MKAGRFISSTPLYPPSFQSACVAPAFTSKRVLNCNTFDRRQRPWSRSAGFICISWICTPFANVCKWMEKNVSNWWWTDGDADQRRNGRHHGVCRAFQHRLHWVQTVPAKLQPAEVHFSISLSMVYYVSWVHIKLRHFLNTFYTGCEEKSLVAESIITWTNNIN